MFQRSSHRPSRQWVVAAIVTLVLAGCGSAAAPILSTVGSSADGSRTAFGSQGAAAATAGPAPAAKQGSDNGAPAADADQQGSLIIKTGTMALRVTGLDSTLATASQRIGALGGYVSGSDRQGDGDDANATVTYRIPAAAWDRAIAALEGLADKVLAASSQTNDVTGQVIDLGARITNLQATETALRDIMARATEIKDVLAVQSELTNVRGQIEELTTEKKHLEEQAAFSTLSVTYVLRSDPVITAQQFDPKNEFDRASASLVDVLQALATAGIWFAVVWLPVLVGLAIVAAIALLVARRLRRIRGDGGAAVPSVV